MRTTRDAIEIIDRVTGDDPELRELIAEAGIHSTIGQLVYDARTRARLTQRELAKRIGTTQSVISRLEDADYEGHSLSLLNRIAAALGSRIELRFVPSIPRRKGA